MISDDSVIIRRLKQVHGFTEADLEKVLELPVLTQAFDSDATIVREGEEPSRSFFLLSGLVGSFKFTGDGRRQIPSFCIPVDAPDLYGLHLRKIDTSFQALVPTVIAFIDHRDLHRVCSESYNVARALWKITLIDGSIFREWELNIGQRNAETRLAHIFCEMFSRLQAVGLTTDNSYEFNVTQQELADAVGLSTVHVNRSLQVLRSEGQLRYDGKRVEILDFERFKQRADFDPAYLHLSPDL